jgi:hypothetical protein
VTKAVFVDMDPSPVDSSVSSSQGAAAGSVDASSSLSHNKKKKKARRAHSLDHLKERVSALLAIYEEHGVPIPPPEMGKGKVWSSRIYGQDKKKQRKNAERLFLEELRLPQLECGLRERGLLMGEDGGQGRRGGGQFGQEEEEEEEDDDDSDEDDGGVW